MGVLGTGHTCCILQRHIPCGHVKDWRRNWTISCYKHYKTDPLGLLCRYFVFFELKYTSTHPPQRPVKPHRRTIARILASLGFVSRRAIKRPLLTLRHRRLRNEFAKKFLRWDVNKWQKVIFSDEKIFRCRPGAQIRCWRQVTEKKFLPNYVVPTTQKPQGVMVWAAMNGKGKLVVHRCPPKVKSGDYQAILGQYKRFICPRCVTTPIQCI